MNPNRCYIRSDEHGNEFMLSRRRLLKLGTFAVLAGMLPQRIFASSAAVSGPERSLNLYHTHTGERLKTIYWAQGHYLPESLSGINYILRDHRTGDIKEVDLGLVDLLFAIRNQLETNRPFHIISGYRSAKTNALLRARGSGVAENSLHLHGKAIDLRIPGRALAVLRNAAIALKRGGVGYYPRSDFVHIDVSRVRSW